MRQSRVFKDKAGAQRAPEQFRASRQSIMCSATIPQRCVSICLVVHLVQQNNHLTETD